MNAEDDESGDVGQLEEHVVVACKEFQMLRGAGVDESIEEPASVVTSSTMLYLRTRVT